MTINLSIVRRSCLALLATVLPVMGPASLARTVRIEPPKQAFEPAILRLNFSPGNGSSAGIALLDLVLIPVEGEAVGRRMDVPTQELAAELRKLYIQLSRQEPLDVANPEAPARQLYRLLITPIEPELKARGINNLLIAADPGLQAIPFAALHDGSTYLGLRYGFSVTPSLALTAMPPATGTQARKVALGASQFSGLAPLPLVPQEAATAAGNKQANLYLNQAFTGERLIAQAADPGVDRVHVATHAEFLPGGPDQARLFTGIGPMSLKQFADLRGLRKQSPLDLIALSACRTALGDTSSELGFAGLAIQSGARSAIGTLWYVDDVATSAYFVLLYRLLDAGWKKSEALQEVRRAFAQGEVSLKGDCVVLADGTVLIRNLTTTQRRRVASGLEHPFFWSGIELLGTPW
jgi:CHAT domain-containing protein